MYCKNSNKKSYRLDWTQINRENRKPKCGKLPVSPRTPFSHQLIDVSINHDRPVLGRPKYKPETEI
jgi:hypothetical protein